MGVQDRFMFTFAGKHFYIFDLQPLGSTMGLGHLAAMGGFLSKYYNMELQKLEECPHKDPSHMVMVKDRAKKLVEKPFKCPTYAMRDSEITFMFARYLLEQNLNPEQIGTPGALAARWFDIPKYNTYEGKSVKLPLADRDLRFYSVFAGRNECYRNGGPYPAHYVDTTSLYPLSMLVSKAPMITGYEPCSIDDLDMKPKLDGDGYGWFGCYHIRVKDKIWSLPIRAENVIYATGDITNPVGGLEYASDDVVAAQGELVDEPHWVERPVFAQRGSKEEAIMVKIRDIYEKRLEGKLAPEQAGLAKGAMNALSGLYGMSQPKAGARTNYWIYSTLLARSHLIMAEWCREVVANGWEIYGFDTDAGVISHPWARRTSIGDVPYRFSVSEKTDMAGVKHKLSGNVLYFRAKQYFFLCDDNYTVGAFHGWRYGKERYLELGAELAAKLKVHEAIQGPSEDLGFLRNEEDPLMVSMQVTKDMDTRDSAVKLLRLGGWVDKDKKLYDKDLTKIFWADRKRNRSNYDSWHAVQHGLWYDSEPWDFVAWKRFSRAERHRRTAPLSAEDIQKTLEIFGNTSPLRAAFGDPYFARKWLGLDEMINERRRARLSINSETSEIHTSFGNPSAK